MKLRFVLLSVTASVLLAVTACQSAETHPIAESDHAVATEPMPPTRPEQTTQVPSRPVATESPATTPPRPMVPVTATPLPGTQSPVRVVRQFSVPEATDAERETAATTRLYLTGFDAYTVSVVDPLSGHSLYEIAVRAQNPGIAVSPGGTRLYVLDMSWERGEPAGKGELTVYDTSSWRALHREPVDRPAFLLGGNPISISGDGRWLIVAHHPDPGGGGSSVGVFDTENLAFLSPVPGHALSECNSPWLAPHLAGRPGHPRVYAQCDDNVVALDSETLSKLWEAKTPSAPHPGLSISPDGAYLYGLYPQVDVRCCVGSSVYVDRSELLLRVWDTGSGRLVSDINLSDLLDVPEATIGRGDGAYLAISPDGQRLYALWEDRLWDVPTATLWALERAAIRETVLPAPADGLTIATDGRELHVLPATAGDLRRRDQGMWTVDAGRLTVARKTQDWPELPPTALFYSAPARASTGSDTTECPGTKGNYPNEPGWYGNPGLRTGLWPEGTVVFEPGGPGFVDRDGALGMKWPWIRGDGIVGKLEIEGRRLDTEAPSPARGG